ncbi:protein kinase domain-containing protein [Pseudonocardia phyllosphaerae]|uniref:protein kinase domain-containing protein n=1 Tax=Pseudonocardia phyllosphaerae TaxID=3390502 RepID=UPI00397B3644
MISGRVVGGRYLLLDPLDRRGFGPAYRAEDRVTGRNVVVTEIRVPADGESPDGMRDRLLTEVRAAGRLRHSGLVGVLDLITDRDADGTLREHLVTERPDARSLSEILLDGPLPPHRAATVGRDVLAALRAIHADGGTHGGLDADSVLVTPDDRGLVTDVGLARAVGAARAPVPGDEGGGFTPPERDPGRPGTGDTPAADLWSLGAVLHHAVGGQPPPGGPLEAAIEELTRPDPAARGEPAEVDLLLERAAVPPSSGNDLGRNRWILLAVAGLLLLVVVVIVLVQIR